ncbi:MAG TPA: 3-dehydro-L-gulonate 2-dehydrogenase [Pyrinomonadaceae bacterium]|nr:3-dehydro-L-gulonate 2-dehydrogenase [Pyrinomonadaceae bacterium]
MLRVTYEELHDVLRRALLDLGFEPERAALCARLFADTDRDGVYSHGLNRFPRFVRMIRRGVVDAHARPALVTSHGALERWEGRRGPGNLNAHLSTERAMELARAHGLGCVALAGTNHWMRGGSYGWQAAEAGAAAVCWTNTLPNLPPWGATEARLGNNPLVVAVPRAGGEHVVLDMAMSQFSYGALESYRARGELLPVPGGYDSRGRLTRDPAAIEHSGRPLPIGFWKGSGLALVLDMLAALLSGGRATHEVAPDPDEEYSVSQVFLACDPDTLGGSRIADDIIRHLQAPSPRGETVRYPGEHTLQTRRRNMAEGIPVDPRVWHQLLEGLRTED